MLVTDTKIMQDNEVIKAFWLILKGYFDHMKDYTDKSPVLAAAVLRAEMDVMADLIANTDIEKKRDAIENHLRNIAENMGALIQATVFTSWMSPTTELIGDIVKLSDAVSKFNSTNIVKALGD